MLAKNMLGVDIIVNWPKSDIILNPGNIYPVEICANGVYVHKGGQKLLLESFKLDKSAQCGIQYAALAAEAWNGDDTKEIAFHAYYDKYCKNCIHMCEICMFAE